MVCFVAATIMKMALGDDDPLDVFGVQLLAAGITIAFTAVATWAILKAVDATIGLRVDEDEEARGLDLSLHAEEGYNP